MKHEPGVDKSPDFLLMKMRRSEPHKLSGYKESGCCRFFYPKDATPG